MKGGTHNPKFLELSKQKSKDKNFCLGYNNVDYNEGVTNFLDMLCQNHVSNYLLNSGIKVLLEKFSVSSYFKKIYAMILNYKP